MIRDVSSALCSKSKLRRVAHPSFWIKASKRKAKQVPPSPPAAYTTPFESPRRLLNHCAGVTDTTMKHKLVPIPIPTPEVTKSPGSDLVAKPERTSLPPRKAIPSSPAP